MSFLEKVAEAPNQREALLLIAGALDMIYEAVLERPVADGDWESGWDNSMDAIIASRGGIDLDDDRSREGSQMHKDGDDWVIPEASKAIRAQRAQFVTNYNIPEGDAYVKGGPEWLTAYDTDFVMTLPSDARQAMAIDFEQRGLTQEAREFAVAFLKGDATTMDTAAPLADTLGR